MTGPPVTELDRHKLAAARVWATARMPYLSSALFAMRVRAVAGTGTVAVDQGWTLTADPAVLDRLETVEAGRLLLHLRLPRSARPRRHAPTRSPSTRRHGGTAAPTRRSTTTSSTSTRCRRRRRPPGDLGGVDHRLAEDYYGNPAAGPAPWDCGSGVDGRLRPWDATGSPHLTPSEAELMRAAHSRRRPAGTRTRARHRSRRAAALGGDGAALAG